MKKQSFSINNRDGFLFILPAFIFYFGFILFPLYNVFKSSLFSINTLSQESTFIGFQNFVTMFTDKTFIRSLANTSIYTIAIIVLINVFAIVFAIIIDRGIIKGNYFLRVVFFIPAILPTVLIGSTFKRIFAPFGALNMIFKGLGLNSLVRTWLGVPTLAMSAVILTTVWQSAGWNLVIYFARLREIPNELYESAEIDGANPWQIIRFIKLPLLKSTVTILVVLNIIGGFKVFDLIYVMTSGGPAHKTEVLTSYLYYQAFNFHKYGYASAVAVIMMLLMLFFSWLRLRGTFQKEM